MSEQQLQQFFAEQLREVQNHSLDVADFTKNHQLPLARIKKIMKSDEDVRMISAEAPVLFAKACEMFILELTIKAWKHAEENKRRTLQRNDVSAAIVRTDIFDFLLDVVPKEDLQPENQGAQGVGQQGTAMQQGPLLPGMPGGAMPPGMFPFLFSMPPGAEALLQGMPIPGMQPGSSQPMQMPGMQPGNSQSMQMPGMQPGSSQSMQMPGMQPGPSSQAMKGTQQQAGGQDAMQGWQIPGMPGMQMPSMPQGSMAMDPAAIMSFMAGLSQQGQPFPFFSPPASGAPPPS